MIHAVVWFVVVVLLALWSLTAWAVHAVAVWAVTNAGALGTVRLPEWLGPWVPPEWEQAVSALLAGLAPLVQSLLQAAPSLAGGLTVVAWGIWAVGSVLLVGVGAASHGLVAMWRRRLPSAPTPVATPSTAAPAAKVPASFP